METTVASGKVWAQAEFGGAPLGDARLQKRLVKVAAALAERPKGALPGCFLSYAELKGAYRFFASEEASFENVLAPHWARTRKDCRTPGEYLLIEDTTLLDFTSHTAAQGLGRIGDNRGQGLHLHSTLALCVARWNAAQEPEVTVQGLLWQRCWVRDDPPKKGREAKAQRLQRQRESQRWAAVFQETGAVPPGVRWTYLADRESDIYEVFQKCQAQGVDFIVRGCWPRALDTEARSVFEAVAAATRKGRFRLKLRARPGQPARQAVLEVRAASVTLRGPWRPGGALPPLQLHVVEAREAEAPEGVEPIHWVLLTSWPCETFEQCLRVVKAYTRRWLIEEYHKALKTGTQVEASQLSTAARLRGLIAVLAVVAVRLLNMKLLAETRADEHTLAEELGPDALTILAAKCGRPKNGWTNRGLLVALARLGGFVIYNKKPGWLTIWRGWHDLMLMTQGLSLARGDM